MTSSNMVARFFRQLIFGLACAFFLPCVQAATVTFSVGMGNVLDNFGSNIATTSLFQLVALGANAVFDPIPPGAWVGGDDRVISLPFSNSDGWTSAAAFDLTDGTGTPGQFSRQFTFTLGTSLSTADKLGIRWFPTVAATDSATTTITLGMPYGQFTRQSSVLYGGSAWVVPPAGNLVSFDPMVTTSYDSANGHDPNSAGAASFHVVGVPEPATSGLLASSLLILATRRARRRR